MVTKEPPRLSSTTGVPGIPEERSMRHFGKGEEGDKGWWAGPWNLGIPVAVGYATTGIDEPGAVTLI